MNAIILLRTSGTTYCNSFKAHIFRSSRCVQWVLNHLCTWNTSWDMDNFINEGSPTLTKKWMRKSYKTETELKMVTNHHLHIPITTIFFKVSSLTRNTLLQPFDPFFFNRLAKFGLGYAHQTSLDFVNDLITFKKPASQIALQGRKQLEIARGEIWAVCWMHHHFNIMHSSHFWTRWAVHRHILLWWSIHSPTGSGCFHLMCSNNFSNRNTYFLAFVPRSSTYSRAYHLYTVCLCLSCLLPVVATRV